MAIITKGASYTPIPDNYSDNMKAREKIGLKTSTVMRPTTDKSMGQPLQPKFQSKVSATPAMLQKNRQSAQNAIGRAYGRTQRTQRTPRTSRQPRVDMGNQIKALKRKGSL